MTNSAISNNKFLKVIIAAKRAKQLLKGAASLVKSSSARATRIAIEEVGQGLIGFKFIIEDPGLRNGRDTRGDRGQGDVGEGSREVINQALVANQTSVARLGGQYAHRCVSLDPKMTCHCSVIGMSEVA
jgi:DNA-directed RNA polymerase omega subunit